MAREKKGEKDTEGRERERESRRASVDVKRGDWYNLRNWKDKARAEERPGRMPRASFIRICRSTKWNYSRNWRVSPRLFGSRDFFFARERESMRVCVSVYTRGIGHLIERYSFAGWAHWEEPNANRIVLVDIIACVLLVTRDEREKCARSWRDEWNECWEGMFAKNDRGIYIYIVVNRTRKCWKRCEGSILNIFFVSSWRVLPQGRASCSIFVSLCDTSVNIYIYIRICFRVCFFFF